ncbi:hypothetical protein AVEN_98387-1 [Araneus ventricosus]|uniref:Uncharacterized protein n=1 Tax=Araneus ventricosus TaxID=182803 RepID=A0A4Y2KMH2_ARAVE|nr:hypothetical protein AVEN_98387-1 [Araneus ventricosus]
MRLLLFNAFEIVQLTSQSHEKMPLSEQDILDIGVLNRAGGKVAFPFGNCQSGKETEGGTTHCDQVPRRRKCPVASSEMNHRLQLQYREECLSRIRMFECCKCFSEGYLFGRLKHDLQGVRFADNDSVIQTMREANSRPLLQFGPEKE